MSRRPRPAGFTMVELLIALLVASVIGVSIYFVFQGQSRIFYTQETIASMQSELRFAMETIKGDIKRAGFLASLNTQTDNQWCGNKPTPALTALFMTDGDGFVFNTAQNVNIAPDSLRILGAFNVSNTFYTTTIQGNVVTLSNDPTLSPGFPATATDYSRPFPAGALLRIVDTSNHYQIQQITSSDFASRTVTLQTITRSSLQGCGPTGLGQGLLVNPVEYVRYRIVDTSSSGSPGTCSNSGALTGRTTLVRENLAPDGATILATTAVADYVVDFQVWFMIDTAPVGSTPAIALDLDPYDFVGNTTNATANASPEQIRSVNIFIAVRTTNEDPGFGFVARQAVTAGGGPALGPLTSFNLDSDTTGSCRVRTLVSEVQLRNFGLSQRL